MSIWELHTIGIIGSIRNKGPQFGSVSVATRGTGNNSALPASRAVPFINVKHGMIVGGRPRPPWNEGIVGVGRSRFPPGNGRGCLRHFGNTGDVVIGVERGVPP